MLMGLPTGYVKTTRPLHQYLDMVAQYRIQSALLKLAPKTTADLEPIVTDIKGTEQIAKHVGNVANRILSAIAI